MPPEAAAAPLGGNASGQVKLGLALPASAQVSSSSVSRADSPGQDTGAPPILQLAGPQALPPDTVAPLASCSHCSSASADAVPLPGEDSRAQALSSPAAVPMEDLPPSPNATSAGSNVSLGGSVVEATCCLGPTQVGEQVDQSTIGHGEAAAGRTSMGRGGDAVSGSGEGCGEGSGGAGGVCKLGEGVEGSDQEQQAAAAQVAAQLEAHAGCRLNAALFEVGRELGTGSFATVSGAAEKQGSIWNMERQKNLMHPIIAANVKCICCTSFDTRVCESTALVSLFWTPAKE